LHPSLVARNPTTPHNFYVWWHISSSCDSMSHATWKHPSLLVLIKSLKDHKFWSKVRDWGNFDNIGKLLMRRIWWCPSKEDSRWRRKRKNLIPHPFKRAYRESRFHQILSYITIKMSTIRNTWYLYIPIHTLHMNPLYY